MRLDGVFLVALPSPKMNRRPIKPQGAEALILPERPALDRQATLASLAGLIWLPFAALAAHAVGLLVEGQAPGPRLLLAIAALAGLRVWLLEITDSQSLRLSLGALGRLRAAFLSRESTRAQPMPAGQAASIAGEQMALIQPYAARYLTARRRAFLQPIAVLIAAFVVSWAAGLILLVTGPLIPIFMALIGTEAERASRAQLDRMGTISAELTDRAGALPDLRLLGGAGALIASFTAAAEDLRRRSMKVLGIAFLSSAVLELFAAIGVAMMAIFCGFSLLGQISFGVWHAPLGPAEAVFLLLIAPEFYQPLRDLASVWHDRAAAAALAGTLSDGGGEAAKMLGSGGGGAVMVAPLTLKGVARHGITYPDLTLGPGEAMALTGPSGAGKTTLLRMIAGLEPPERGAILLGGRLLDGASADEWRAGLGWMPQAPHFLDASLQDNLTLGRAIDPGPALHLADAEGIVTALPEGLATRLGENGAGVSGGEARRLTLARALAGAPCLILADEPTADLDLETAARVRAGLLAAHRAGAGLIVATHDPELAAMLPRQIAIGSPR